MSVRTNALVFILAAMAVPGAITAQSSLGIKAGFAYGTLSNKLPDWDNRSGFAAGLAFDLRSESSVLGVQPEVLYVQKGVSVSGSPSEDSPKLDYIDTPILIKFQTKGDGVRPMVYAGPSFSFRLSCKFGDTDCSDTIKDTDYGVVAGAGLRFGGRRAFTLEARYTWGLQDINDIAAGVDSKTRTFLVLLGAGF